MVVVENNGIAQSTPTSRQWPATIAGRAAAFGLDHVPVTSTDVAAIRARSRAGARPVRTRRRPLVVEFATPCGSARTARATTPAPRRTRAAAAGATGTDAAPRAPTSSSRPSTPSSAHGRGGQPRRAAPGRPSSVGAAHERRLVAENLNRGAARGSSPTTPNCSCSARTSPTRTAAPSRSPGAVHGLPRPGAEHADQREPAHRRRQRTGAVRRPGDRRGHVRRLRSPWPSTSSSTSPPSPSPCTADRDPTPVVVRCPVGGGRGYGPTHSQSLQKHFIGVPNLALYETLAVPRPGTVVR